MGHSNQRPVKELEVAKSRRTREQARWEYKNGRRPTFLPGAVVKERSSTTSPLRYPGGKSRAVSQILDLLPDDLEVLCSPFVGGASVELACAQRDISVRGYDAFEPLVNFWSELRRNSKALAQTVMEYFPLERNRFYELQKQFPRLRSPHKRAAVFYVLNRSSYSGTTLSGGMSPGHPRFTETSIERLSKFSAINLSVELADYQESIRMNPSTFLYLDPPYANGGRLYGERGDMHEGFDHATLAGMLRSRGDWLLSYNDCELVRDLYVGHEFRQVEWSYGMNNSRQSNEVLILSRD